MKVGKLCEENAYSSSEERQRLLSRGFHLFFCNCLCSCFVLGDRPNTCNSPWSFQLIKIYLSWCSIR